MNEWLWAAAVLSAALVPLAVVAVRAPLTSAIVALEAASADAALALLLIAQGTERQPFADLALILAIVSYLGAIAFLRFLARAG
jgi:multisubunit Na+/H+ antiporter MnhF subunit